MKVSVVIPVYNVKPYLERCVKSVLRQTYKDLEIFLVDDGSTDGSGEMCDQIATRDPRILVIHQKNQGLSGARNTGIHHATGEYILFLDSDDDWLLDDGVETLLRDIDTTIDLILFRNVNIWKNDIKSYPKDYDIENISLLPDAQAVFTHLVLTQQFLMSACFLLIRRSVLIEHEIYFPIGYISEDLQWSLHLWQHVRKVSVKNLYFYGYYHHTNSISTTTTLRAYDSYDKIFTYWKQKCKVDCVNSDAIRHYMANMWVNRGYLFYVLPEADKPAALAILQRHADLLQYAVSPKAKRVAKLVKIIGIRNTAYVLGIYWQLRTWGKRHAV